jgi:protein O-GlcNAc transferase
VMSLWARILTAVPGSKLLMKDRSGTLGYPTRRRYVEDVFRYHGIEADRLELCGKEPDYGKHLACYGRVDVVLDPFPYNGTTTTCEALWMGVPVVTLAGKTHVSRVGMSILSAIDLRSMVAATPDEYVNKAVALARDTDELAFLRETLRPRMSRSPLTDAKRYTRELEKLYRQMWVRWCAVAEREAGPVVSMRE